MLMRSSSRLGLSLLLALALPAVGCGSTGPSEQAQTADSAVSRAPVAKNAHGPVRVIGEALGDVPLTAVQRTQIEQWATDAEARHADARADRKALMLAIADQAQAGRIDRAALQPRMDALAAALDRAQPADRASFEQLHSLLTADQRVAFVDALEARIDGHQGQAGEKHPLRQWAEDLHLTDEQRTQIRTALADHFRAARAQEPADHGDVEGRPLHGSHPWAEGAERGAKMLAAFKQDRFVMAELAPPRDLSKVVSKMSDHFLGVAEVVLPLLTPEQRATAAQKIRDRADSMLEIGPSLR